MPAQPERRNRFWTAFHANDLPALRRALAQGFSPDAPWPAGAVRGAKAPAPCALWLAACLGRCEIIAALLDAGADVEGGARWRTPLLAAVVYGRPDAAELLRARGARVHFLVALAQGDTAAVKKALARDRRLAACTDESGCTALHIAAMGSHTPAARLLLRHGAAVDARAARGETPLFVACDRRGVENAAARRQVAFLKLLIHAGAAVNQPNDRGVTPLHVAVRARSVGAVELLLAHGADPAARDKGRGSTPLKRAQFSTGASGTKGRMKEAQAIQKLLTRAQA